MEDKPIEAEVVPQSQALAIRPEQPVQPGLFGTTQPAEVIAKASEVATALKDVVKKQGLVSTISGKEYPRCEAWTLLGTMLGVFPVMCWTRKVEGGWEARVEARTKDGAVVGAAEAECLRSEKNWGNRDDFALRSMAQTRATAKALRMPLGFVMTLAGYEVTPAEEMVSDHPKRSQDAPKASAPPSSSPPPPKAAPTPKSASIPASPEKCRAKFAKNIDEAGMRQKATQFLIDLTWLLPTETLETMEFRYVPQNKEQYVAFLAKVTNYSVSGKAEKPYEPGEIDSKKPWDLGPKKVEVPRDENPDPDSPDAPWRVFPVPFGKHAGKKLAALEKNILWGFWANFRPEPSYQGNDGKVHMTKPEKLAKDRKFRAMLDEAGKHYEFKEPEEGGQE